MVGSVVDGVLAHEGKHRAEAVAKVTGGIHLLVDLATADVDGANGLLVGSCGKGTRREREGIVGVARAAVHVGVDVATHDVDGVRTSHVDRVLLTKGATIHAAVHRATLHIDDGMASRGTVSAAAKHIAAHVGTAIDRDGGG